jgi:hypothetical protein
MPLADLLTLAPADETQEARKEIEDELTGNGSRWCPRAAAGMPQRRRRNGIGRESPRI